MLLKEKTAFYRVCFNSMQVGILVCNKNKKIVLANNPLATIFNYSIDEIHDKYADELFLKKNLFDDFIKNPTNKKYKNSLECIGINKNGQKIILELSFGEMIYENKFYYKALIADITERKKKENELNNINVQLEKEVELRNKELEKVIEKLKISLNKEKELNRLKTNFITLASHEFKTPLSAILSSSELIVKYSDLNNTEKINQHLHKIKTLIHHLNKMIDSLLTLENIESGEITPIYSNVNLNDLILEIIENSKSLLFFKQKVIFDKTCNETVYQDKKILKIIISNILYNAIKYSKEDSDINIFCKNTNDFIELSIRDRGIGIPEQDQPLIFERFFRANNASYLPGTGVGLNIVKGYINLLKGNISFKSTENIGTVFCVKIPKVLKNE